MPSEKRKIGDIGEQIASNYLCQNGYKILARNYQKPWGEIDVIAQKGKIIYFIEVKTKTKQSDIFAPEININHKKRHCIFKTANSFLKEKRVDPDASWQIDAIAIQLNLETRLADLKHIKHIIY